MRNCAKEVVPWRSRARHARGTTRYDRYWPVPGPPGRPEKGVVLGFWMGKDSKDHPLGSRGASGGPGFAESGARNWVHSAATVLAFLQKERGLLRPGYRFQPTVPDAGTLVRTEHPKPTPPPSRPVAPGVLIEASDRATQ